MARYTGPKEKIARRFGVALFGPSKALELRAFPPGQHGPRNARRKTSDYGTALIEKQKLRHTYGVLEKQFRKFFAEASRRKGVTGTILLQMLEQRLDNVVYRMSFANSRFAARQIVGHGHVTVNGKRVNIASYQVKAGDVVAVKNTPRSQQLVNRFLDLTQGAVIPDWMTVDRDKHTGTVNRAPEREEIDVFVNEQLVVELYSR
ncbi:small subunit ribosomal protein S4 [Roseimicrobium gellanilyticum]|uniref:Small ribosomal subunit protein uS4 n=1 Tax=Roseimicrobium gellanilyticum TaxID=748857 RepID=A0A366HPB1_9BACT|nr:30S ribosomal protein S4 [Roseimicrobium gellanilyticum]RBP44290.1 small subunit ribosomal protein S4 [Roseimicrobium gellanilyticum]